MTIGGCWDGKWNFMLLYAQIWKYWNANVKAEARGEMKSPYKEILVARRSKTDRVESRQKSGIERQRKTERKQSCFEGKMYKWARKRAESISEVEGVTFRHTPPVIYLAEEITKNGRKASRYTPGRKISMHTKTCKTEKSKHTKIETSNHKVTSTTLYHLLDKTSQCFLVIYIYSYKWSYGELSIQSIQ